MYGYVNDDDLILSEAQALPNAGSADSTNIVNIEGLTNFKLVVEVFANTDIAIATGQAFSIELEVGTTSTQASAESPIENAHVYMLHKTSADGALAYSAGDRIAQMVLPDDLLSAGSYKYAQLKYTTDADESSEKVDAFIRVAV